MEPKALPIMRPQTEHPRFLGEQGPMGPTFRAEPNVEAQDGGEAIAQERGEHPAWGTRLSSFSKLPAKRRNGAMPQMGSGIGPSP